MMRPTFTKLLGLALMFIITAAIGTSIVQSRSEPETITTSQSAGISAGLLAPGTFWMRPCKPRSTIAGRLTRRTDVFGDEVPQYRPVKGEPVFLWNAEGDEVARTRTDR
ncbi:MAG: hypothetical protein ND895_10645, partial [Pyrinomonadaceae bacterium]|nr:hypothetical protein [Pyrinomonadaceae bacterium]